MNCTMSRMIDLNLRLRRIESPTPEERDDAAKILLRVADIMRCTIEDLAAAFLKDQPT